MPSVPVVQAAQLLVDRLGALSGAPAQIVWELGLRRDRRLNGYTRGSAPTLLHVDPDLGREMVLETVAHEWIHSIEFRGLVPRETFAGDVGDCTLLAILEGVAIGRAAVGAPAHIDLPGSLASAIARRGSR